MSIYASTASGMIHRVDYGGEGTPIVLVHGLGGSAANWNAVGHRFARLGSAIAIDLPGFGLSPARADWSVGTNVEALRDFLLTLEPPAILIGNSMGGLVSEMVAARHPELVSALVLVSPATPPRLPDPLLHWPTAARLTIQATPVLGGVLARYYRHRYDPAGLVRMGLERISHKPSRIPPDVVRDLVSVAATRYQMPWAVDAIPGGARSTASLWLRRSKFVAMIREVSCPTLVIQGEADPIVSPTAVEWLCSLRSDWVHVRMPDTGHTPQLDAPVRFFNTVAPWLEAHLQGQQLASSHAH